jgi:hypothetical protein
LPSSAVSDAWHAIFERYARTAAAFIRLAMIRINLKRLVANPLS